MRELLRRAMNFARHRRLDDELAEEIAFHRAMKERDFAEAGLAPADGARAAQRALGNDLLARDRARDVWVAPWIQDLLQDLRFAARLFVKEPGFTAVAVLALGLGIGVNNTLFTVLNAFGLKSLPIEDPDRVVYIATQFPDGRSRGLSFPEFLDLGGAGSVAALAAYADAPAALRDEARQAERVRRTYISAAGFGIIGEAPVRGRDFLPEDDRPGAPPVAILGGGLWKSRFGTDPGIVGRTVSVDGVATTVVGVMREGFGFPHSTELWQPLAALPDLRSQPRDARALGVFGRLGPRALLASARAEIETAGQRWARDYPSAGRFRVTVVPINERFLQSLTHPAWIAFALTGLLMVLIACANVANLLLGRAVVRAREIAIRTSLGATRSRVVRQLLVESALLALTGTLLGLTLSIIGVRLFEWPIPAAVRSYWLDFSMDQTVFAALALGCVGTVFLFGLVPALHVSRAPAVETLQEGARTVVGGARAHRWSTVFLTVEFALTMILLASVGDTLAAYLARQKADRVFDPSPLLTMHVAPPQQTYTSTARRAELYDRLGERLAANGALSGWALASALPLGGGAMSAVEIEGQPGTRMEPVTGIRSVAISDRYFATLGVQLPAGRAFTRADGITGSLSAIVNETFARAHFAESAIGRRLRFSRPVDRTAAPWLTIVGVAPDIRQTPAPDPEPVVYVPLRSEPPVVGALIVRAPVDPSAAAPAVRAELRAIDPDLPTYRVLSMRDSMAESSWNVRVSTVAVITISLIALCLSLVGLYAVTAHAVTQRAPEIGVRVALGATRTTIGWLVMRRAGGQLAMGLAAGLVLTLAWSRLFSTSVWFKPLNLVGVMLVVVVVAAIACLAPARRAMRLDPVAALRNGA